MPGLPLLLLLLWGVGSHGFPAASETQEQDVEMVQKYLENYYNLKDDWRKIPKQRGNGLAVEKLKQMQEFFGLKVTGKPDAETLKMMKQPRCGVPDVAQFVLTPGNPRWEQTHLTYRIENYTPDLSRADVDNAIEKAFQLWSNVTPLTFTKVSKGQADIMISFVRGDHRDNSPFDGPEGQLAHAFQPGLGIGGDVHFDEDDRWTKDFRNYNLYRVAAHELGHSLGLSHSTDIGALMYPNYMFSGDVQLAQDDIDGIQAIYGPSQNPSQPVGPQTPKVCDSKLTFDAITTIRGEIMFFKDRFYMRANPYYSEVELNFISVFWPHLPNGLQAAYEVAHRDEILFFKGNKYWTVQGQNELPGYPKDIHSSFGFPRSVNHIDAAVSEEDTGKTYFFVANKYWRYDEYKRSMDAGYPKMIEYDFPGIGNKVDAVFKKDGFFYFFHGTRQYKFDPKTKRILTLQKANSWFNCRKN
ncbi:interstitial collagenase precursor [Oryctolagus cuniculus]|uniref:Interstitial collagenase n=1 Tax=Oryctolagus cuniculus TaxID=9986 RepID=MMP1_RABIT|nr:interstitial collagenase precursor [Oryctolagus cuniculus]P13943.1 RecName: Full=Interstitial collagenase; AltName: Full=Matrix metalloproteinase-1; Short=MMP-1; Flags: Precursor [Oryctolagus cuniculus]AAB88016.1 collagenase-1 precursor [Oryctolagus cuniculus]